MLRDKHRLTSAPSLVSPYKLLKIYLTQIIPECFRSVTHQTSQSSTNNRGSALPWPLKCRGGACPRPGATQGISCPCPANYTHPLFVPLRTPYLLHRLRRVKLGVGIV